LHAPDSSRIFEGGDPKRMRGKGINCPGVEEGKKKSQRGIRYIKNTKGQRGGVERSGKTGSLADKKDNRTDRKGDHFEGIQKLQTGHCNGDRA